MAQLCIVCPSVCTYPVGTSTPASTVCQLQGVETARAKPTRPHVDNGTARVTYGNAGGGLARSGMSIGFTTLLRVVFRALR